MEVLANYPVSDTKAKDAASALHEQPSEKAVNVEILSETNLNRRQFLKAGLFSAGGLVMAFSLPMPQKAYAQTESSTETKTAPVSVSAWLQLDEQGKIILLVPAVEMGQGSQTALAMIFADELGLDIENIVVKPPLNNPVYNNPIIGIQVTGGSTAVRAWWQPLTKIAATLRMMLEQAAAQKWQIAANQCTTRNNRVYHADGQTSLGFEKLIAQLDKQPVPQKLSFRSPNDYRYIGQAVKRVDTPSKINGSAIFGMDVQLPDMLVATVAQSPVFGGEVASYDKDAAMAIKGVKAVVPITHGIAVVAEGYWQAKKGLDALQVRFKGGASEGLDNAKIDQILQNGLQKSGETVKSAKAVKKHHQQIQAVYQAPYLAHTTMEPMNATAWVTNDKCEVWAPTQNQTMATQVAADVSLLQPSQVTIHSTYLGGGFGRRANVDYIAQAVALALEMGQPVKVIWSRKEDIQHDFYRPAALCEFKVKTDKSGLPLEWHSKIVSDSVIASFSGGSATMIDNAMSEGIADQEYQLNMQLQVVRENLKIPLGFWRSVGHSYSGFFMEGMINQLARQAKRDPFEYRQAMLPPQSRSANLLRHLHKLADWQGNISAIGGRGVACVHSFASYVGEVVDAHIEGDKIVVDRVYCVVDCGKVVNPEIVRRQMSSAIIYGLTAALHGEIHFDNGKVLESNYHDYPMLQPQEVPEIIVEIIDSQEAPGGYGEPGLPPLAPALAAALTALTNKDYQRLPLRI